MAYFSFSRLQELLRKAEKIDDNIPLTVSLIEIKRIDSGEGWESQGQIDYWTNRLERQIADYNSELALIEAEIVDLEELEAAEEIWDKLSKQD